MGLVSNRTSAVGSESDAALLVHGMMCIAGADGSFSEAEVRMVEAYFAQLPELRGRDFEALVDGARRIIERHGNSKSSLSELRALSTSVLKTKLFVVAADIALATGRIEASEESMLKALQSVLSIDDGTASKVLEVLALKYA